jgi:uncharacterized surface protein with fasciclin (FAS1) repeats
MLRKFSRTQLLVSGIALATAIAGSTVMTSMPSSALQQEKEGTEMMAAEGNKTIVEVATDAGSFTILTAALEAADLVDVLEGPGPFTVFAPTDEAFAALPEGTVEKLLKPENKDKLVKILTYHVVPGAVMSTDLKAGPVATVEGSEVTIELGDHVKVDGAKVVKADIKASNGVIHVIDQVIIPAD